MHDCWPALQPYPPGVSLVKDGEDINTEEAQPLQFNKRARAQQHQGSSFTRVTCHAAEHLINQTQGELTSTAQHICQCAAVVAHIYKSLLPLVTQGGGRDDERCRGTSAQRLPNSFQNTSRHALMCG
jgi:hypothetical protein